VAKANEYVNQGNKALGQAKELQKDTRKWMCCAMMLLLGICLIVVLAVVKPWQARASTLRPAALAGVVRGRYARCALCTR